MLDYGRKPAGDRDTFNHSASDQRDAYQYGRTRPWAFEPYRDQYEHRKDHDSPGRRFKRRLLYDQDGVIDLENALTFPPDQQRINHPPATLQEGDLCKSNPRNS